MTRRLPLLLALLLASSFTAWAAAEEALDTPRGPLATDQPVPESNDVVAAFTPHAGTAAPLVVAVGDADFTLTAPGFSFAATRAQLALRLAGHAGAGAALLDDSTLVRDALRLRLIDRLGADECQALLTQPDGPAFLGWLLNHGELLQEVAASYPTGGSHQTAPDGTAALWLKLWQAQAPAEREQYRRLAAGLAQAHSHRIRATGGGLIDPLARYAWYRDRDQAGELIAYFRQADVHELVNITSVARSDEDLAWAHEHVGAKKRTMDGVGYWLKYTKFNKDGVSVQRGAAFYDHKPTTFPILAEYGGVCGAISHTNTDVRRAWGLPSFPVGQPGHCAFITKTSPTAWRIKNNISGWAKTTGVNRFAPWGSNGDYMQIFGEVMHDPLALRRAELLVTAAALTADPGAKRACLLAALSLVPRHYGAWERLAALRAADAAQLKARAEKLFAAYAAPRDALLKAFDRAAEPPGKKPRRK